MGGDPTTPAATLKIPPITGNDIFASRASLPTPANEGTPSPSIFSGSLPPVASPSHFLPPHPIEDDDFPPDLAEDQHDPPEVPQLPDYYPSMEDAEENRDDSETENEGEAELNLEDFMDWEYLKQGRPCLLHKSHHTWGLTITSDSWEPLEI